MSAMAPITHGTTLRRARLADHTFVESVYEPGTRLPPHHHVRPYLVLVLDGTFEERSTGGRYACGRGTVMVRPGGTRHADRFGSRGTRCLIAEIGETSAVEAAFADVRQFDAGPVTGVAARIYLEVRRPDTASHLVVDGLLRQFAGLVKREHRDDGRAESVPPMWLKRARERLREDFRDPPRIRDIAEEVGIHPDHLSRMFRRYYGELPGEYVRSLRLESAAEELLAGEISIATVAVRAGFCDQSHFTRAFKSCFGLTPGRFRGATR